MSSLLFSALHSAHSVGAYRPERIRSCGAPFRRKRDKKIKRFNSAEAEMFRSKRNVFSCVSYQCLR